MQQSTAILVHLFHAPHKLTLSHTYENCKTKFSLMLSRPLVQCNSVRWCLTSLFSTNIWLHQGRKGWRAIPTQYRKASDILTSTLAAFLAATQKGKGIERLF